MFIKNKYLTIYYQIIKRAKDRTLNGYTEKHHIIPKSLGGNNKKENIVVLTAREHFICHRLLVKMTEGDNKRKMSYALNMMLSKTKIQKRHTPNSRVYEYLKEEFNKINPFKSKEFIEENKKRLKGKIVSEETRLKQSLAWTDERKKNNPLKGRKTGKRPWNYGIKCPQLQGENNGFYGKTHSEEFKTQLANKKRGLKPPWYRKKKLCPHCNKEFDLGNFSRYHGDKCHQKTNDQDPAG